MSTPDTITISRDLFERLCEAAIEIEASKRWMADEGRKRQLREYADCLATMKEAVAIRDGGCSDEH